MKLLNFPSLFFRSLLNFPTFFFCFNLINSTLDRKNVTKKIKYNNKTMTSNTLAFLLEKKNPQTSNEIYFSDLSIYILLLLCFIAT